VRGLLKLIVQPGLHGRQLVGLGHRSASTRQKNGGSRKVGIGGAEIHVIVFQHPAPVLGEGVLSPHAEQPSRTGVRRAGARENGRKPGDGGREAACLIQPSPTALDEDKKAAVTHDTTDATRSSRKPVIFGGAAEHNDTRRTVRDPCPRDITFDAQDNPTGLVIVANLPTAQNATVADLGQG
jgi:hypothetical protein